MKSKDTNHANLDSLVEFLLQASARSAAPRRAKLAPPTAPKLRLANLRHQPRQLQVFSGFLASAARFAPEPAAPFQRIFVRGLGLVALAFLLLLAAASPVQAQTQCPELG